MMRTWASRLLIGAAAALLVLLVAGVFLPQTRSVEREVTIAAWPATVFALIEDSRRAAEWSPWLGGAAPPRFTGPPAGAGAAFAWGGARPGRRQVVEVARHTRVVASLEVDGTDGISRFGLEPVAGGTRIAWRLELDFGNDLPARWGALLRRRAIEARMEAGLASLATLAENLPAADFGDLAIESLNVEALPVAWRSVDTRPDPAAVSRALGQAFFDILAFIRRHGLSEAGPPLAVTRAFSGPELRLDAGIPVDGLTDATPRAANGIRLGRSYAGLAIRATHRGSYGQLAETHRKIAAWLAAYGVRRNGDPWEVYVNDPARTPEAERVTLVYYPVQPRAASGSD